MDESPSCLADKDCGEWIQLSTGKDFSRLLYPNPVCFLYAENTPDIKTTPSSPPRDRGESDANEQRLSIDKIKGPGGEVEADRHENDSKCEGANRNVQVLSWLTATDNEGSFIFSINQRRYTSSLLLKNSGRETKNFTLSVPSHGMEKLVLQVGSTSGLYGSKFPADHFRTGQPSQDVCDSHNSETKAEAPPLSKRQRKKQHKSPFPKGIPGLETTKLGHNSSETLLVIQGTVAHLSCRVIQCMDHPPLAKDNQRHFLVLAQVVAAYVHRDYWDLDKKHFCPLHSSTPPYLTFLGSQVFGYVHAEP